MDIHKNHASKNFQIHLDRVWRINSTRFKIANFYPIIIWLIIHDKETKWIVVKFLDKNTSNGL